MTETMSSPRPPNSARASIRGKSRRTSYILYNNIAHPARNRYEITRDAFCIYNAYDILYLYIYIKFYLYINIQIKIRVFTVIV